MGLFWTKSRLESNEKKLSKGAFWDLGRVWFTAIGHHAMAWRATGMWRPFRPPQKTLFRGESTLHVVMGGFQPNIPYVCDNW